MTSAQHVPLSHILVLQLKIYCSIHLTIDPMLDKDKQLTIEPVDGSLSRGGVIKGHGGLPLQLPRLSVCVQVDHGQARLLVDLRGR